MTAQGPSPPSGRTGGGALVYRDLLRRAQHRTLHWVRREAGELRPEGRHLRRDVVAGLPGAISSVPDGMASSLLAGVNPAHGLYASIAGPIAGGLSSSTRLMVVTTTSAAALAAGSALTGYSPADRSTAMLDLTLVAGGFMLLAAALQLSRYIRFVSYSVMLGFLTGVAVNMVLGQLPALAGIDVHGRTPVAKAWDALSRLGQADTASMTTGAAALAVLVTLGVTRVAVFSSVVALAVPTIGVIALDASSVARVRDTGRIPSGLPAVHVPDLGLMSFHLVGGAAAVAALVLIQGAGVAEAVPNLDGSRSSIRRDFVAQGLGNLASSVVGGQPVGGSVGQTALNVGAGAVSRWGSICSGIWLALILLAFSGVVGQVAMPTLAAVLVYAGIGAIRPREVVAAARAGLIPCVAMLATFTAVLALPVAQAVGVGVAASLLLQLRQDALDLRVVRLGRDADGRVVETPAPAAVHPGEVVVLDAYGSLFYAGARTLQRRLPIPSGAPAEARTATGPTVVLRLRGRSTLGATFLKVVGDYAVTLAAANGRLYLSGVDPALVRRWSTDGTARRLAGVRIEPATPVLGASTGAAVDAALRGHRVTPQDGEHRVEE